MNSAMPAPMRRQMSTITWQHGTADPVDTRRVHDSLHLLYVGRWS
jgi:hypothetical protein